ncbi:hypothetical protein GCM10012280_16860 [Wenjunlia tyrosinilytica]|uniref:Gram-positive cocci surface proteins LPxTG domain-containing protein n=1 Tax=Wenjunlia tyrosinilytica TaxID=1544741 RepID=A0A917ZKV0_9ACTN|nr:hypothetical protein GCM10012280_16860 [Wenjunlia tyrosinilytica]
MVGLTALLATGVMATPASAHTPVWTVDCSKVTVDLTAYNPRVTNKVTITADGKDLLPTRTFGREFHKVVDIPTHHAKVSIRLVVEAGDGAQFSKDDTKVSPVCEGQDTPQSPSPRPTPSKPAPSKPAPTPSSTPSSAAPSAPAHTPDAGSSTPGDLAETGASSSTPIIAGVAGAALLAGAGLVVVATRKRRTSGR